MTWSPQTWLVMWWFSCEEPDDIHTRATSSQEQALAKIVRSSSTDVTEISEYLDGREVPECRARYSHTRNNGSLRHAVEII